MEEKLIKLGQKIENYLDKLSEIQKEGQDIIDEMGYEEFERMVKDSEELFVLNERVNSKLEKLLN